MSDDILSGYGRDSGTGEKPRATNGGHQTPRDVHNYSPPRGPSNINDPQSPGLHGTNHGCCVNQGKH